MAADLKRAYLVLSIFNGRPTPDEPLDNNGIVGPEFLLGGPVAGVYHSHLKIDVIDPTDLILRLQY